ncbi:lipocalin family protein [Galbibacter sp. EGI 63066]|uniref:lipocalin family protein n=1 Tax=Galbibacter sp. EGI 63066 TaxID=2993559 RepID=UPI002248B80A|nr:lipocalin family protein [Galbibacter sp. EGI 63066]MCX2678789.1 lipocalin family protein [Galbibacter sp. EGI 63066]
MKKLTSFISKIASTLHIDLSDQEYSNSPLIGKWQAVSYTEKTYENGKLNDGDHFSYNEGRTFYIIFKKNGTFVQGERTENDVAEKISRKGTYSVENDKITLTYSGAPEGENTVILTFTITDDELTTHNDYERKDVDDVYRHISKRVFVKN